MLTKVVPVATDLGVRGLGDLGVCAEMARTGHGDPLPYIVYGKQHGES